MPQLGAVALGLDEAIDHRVVAAAEEDRRRKEEGMRKKLTEDLMEEAKFAKLNLAKIQNQWRKLMRLAKVETLRKDLEIMSQNHEREVDMKDAIIQMLDRDRKRQISSPLSHTSLHGCSFSLLRSCILA